MGGLLEGRLFPGAAEVRPQPRRVDGEQEERADHGDRELVAARAIAGGLWKLVDREGRTLWDRLFGLVVVEDVVPATMPDRLWSPWGT